MKHIMQLTFLCIRCVLCGQRIQQVIEDFSDGSLKRGLWGRGFAGHAFEDLWGVGGRQASLVLWNGRNIRFCHELLNYLTTTSSEMILWFENCCEINLPYITDISNFGSVVKPFLCLERWMCIWFLYRCLILAQDCSNSSVLLAMELQQSCTKPSISFLHTETMYEVQILSSWAD